MLLDQHRRIKLTFNNEIKGNFIRIPGSIADGIYLSNIKIQQFRFKLDDKWFVSWDGFESFGGDSIEINPVLGNILGLKSGRLISFKVEQFSLSKSLVTEVHVKPLSSDDWEIAELNSRYLQDEILNQTKIVNLGGTIVCYVGNSVCKFTVEKIIPENIKVGVIGDGSMIIVEPMENQFRNKKVDFVKEKRVVALKSALCWNILDESATKFNQPMEGMEILINLDETESNFAYVSVIENNIDREDLNSTLRASIKSKSYEKSLKPAKRIAVRVSPIPQGIDQLPRSYAILGKQLWNSLPLPNNSFPNNGLKLKLEFVVNNSNAETSNHEKLKFIVHHLDNDVSFNRDILLKNNHFITNNQFFKREKCLIELIGSDGSHIPFVNITKLPQDTIEIVEKLNSIIEFPAQSFTDHENLTSFVKANNMLDEIVNYFKLPITPSPGVLIEGAFGIGKTTMLKQLSTLIKSNTVNNVRYFDCESIPDSFSFDKMKKFISNYFISLPYWYQPSIVILDNAEFLFNKVGGNEESNNNNTKNGNNLSNKLTLFLINEIDKIAQRRSNCIRILFATTRKNMLNFNLYDKHFIGKIWSLKSPIKQERCIFVKSFLDEKNIILDNKLDFNDISMEIEGYSVLDIKNLIERLFYEFHISGKIAINKRTFERIKDNFIPLFLQKVKLQNNKNSDVTKNKFKWEQIGGLDDAKKILLETLEWPVKYAPIFQNCPLRLRSGILIYGYPGCGKTLLANTISNQCGLNFIPVKGPEILNKYIGASEQNVRELFERAQSIKPCILFFDEFDSIATKRGHDSTGVTDRVVNQLLTQMDGAEGLDGVYVVAATSRPDLIDPALLRPGRLDKSVFCNIPNKKERFDIIQKILLDESNNISLDEPECITEENLHEIVELTRGLSGADLQGLCYTAYLKAVHRNLDDLKINANDTEDASFSNDQNYDTIELTIIDPLNPNIATPNALKEEISNQLQMRQGIDASILSNDNHTKDKLYITLTDLVQCCRETRPSISAREYAKLNAVYQDFQGASRAAELRDGENSAGIGTRLSLA